MRRNTKGDIENRILFRIFPGIYLFGNEFLELRIQKMTISLFYIIENKNNLMIIDFFPILG